LAGALPQIPLERLQHFPWPLAVFKGPYFCGEDPPSVVIRGDATVLADYVVTTTSTMSSTGRGGEGEVEKEVERRERACTQ